MANSTAAFGFLEFGRREGGSPTAGQTRGFIASSDPNPIFCGDPVANSTTNGQGNYITWCATGAGGQLVRGIFRGCEFFSPTVGRQVWSRFWPGAVQTGGPDAIAYFNDDPDELYYARCSSGTALGASVVGLNIGFVPSSQGNTLDGHSVATLAASGTVGSTNALPFRIVDIFSNYAPPGADDTSSGANMVLVVAPNAFDRAVLTARSS